MPEQTPGEVKGYRLFYDAEESTEYNEATLQGRLRTAFEELAGARVPRSLYKIALKSRSGALLVILRNIWLRGPTASVVFTNLSCWRTGATITSFTAKLLDPDTTYRFQVRRTTANIKCWTHTPQKLPLETESCLATRA